MSASDARAGVRPVPACTDEVCLTCSDAAVPARVLELLADGMATVDAGAGAGAGERGARRRECRGHRARARGGGHRCPPRLSRGPRQGAETLYPFLAGGPASGRGDVETVLADIRRSTVAKVEEIAALRQECLTRFGDPLDRCARDLAARFAAGARLFAFGNGGSSTDAQDLAALFLSGGGAGRPLPALCLTADVAAVTALANDVAFDVVFARQLAALARPGDVAVGLSTSGNSANLIRAFDVAARQGLLTVGFAGYEGGQMAEMDVLDYLFVVPSASVHRIQEAQTTLYQALWELTINAVEDERAHDLAGTSPGPRGSPGRPAGSCASPAFPGRG